MGLETEIPSPYGLFVGGPFDPSSLFICSFHSFRERERERERDRDRETEKDRQTEKQGEKEIALKSNIGKKKRLILYT